LQGALIYFSVTFSHFGGKIVTQLTEQISTLSIHIALFGATRNYSEQTRKISRCAVNVIFVQKAIVEDFLKHTELSLSSVPDVNSMRVFVERPALW